MRSRNKKNCIYRSAVKNPTIDILATTSENAVTFNSFVVIK
jgi:hypothetical protein